MREITYLRSWIDDQFEFAGFWIVLGQLLHEQRREARACASPKGMEHEEALETRASVCQLPNSVHNGLYQVLTHAVAPSRVIVCRILFPGNQLLGVVQGFEGTITHAICDIRKFLC